MTEPIVSWAVGFLTGGFFGFRSGWLWGRGGAVRRTPFIFNEGHATRTNSGPGPTTPKPEIVPGFHGPRRTVRWFINNPVQIAECGGPCTVGPTHCDCGALWVDVPTTPKPDIVPKPQPPSGRVVDVYGRTIGYIPRSQGDTPNPPPSNP